MHVLSVGTPAGPVTDEIRNKNVVVARGTEESGGRREQLLADMAIPGALVKVADELMNQYVVSYSRPNSTVPPEKLKVTVKNPELTGRARTRLPNTR